MILDERGGFGVTFRCGPWSVAGEERKVGADQIAVIARE